MNILNLINELVSFRGKGSAAGRQKMRASQSPSKFHSKAPSSRARTYKSITTALKKGSMGQIFTTKGADRLYVITKRKWGKDDEQMVAGRVAKGFSEKTPYKDVKKYSLRTLQRHGKYNTKAFKRKKK